MNVVVLVIDDTRWDSIGAAGNRIVRTPHLDRLASEGIHFTQARVDDVDLHDEPGVAADRASTCRVMASTGSASH